MTFTNEQLQILSKWEYNFNCAVKANWSPNPGETNAKLIHEIFKAATGDQRRVCYNCQHSLLSLIKDCGQIYFRDKAELEKMQNSAKAVEVSQEPAEPVKRVEVKTKKKVTKKVKK